MSIFVLPVKQDWKDTRESRLLFNSSSADTRKRAQFPVPVTTLQTECQNKSPSYKRNYLFVYITTHETIMQSHFPW